MSELELASCLVVRDGKLLLLHRRDHDHWETPGGKIDPEDQDDPDIVSRADLERCALRELAEEVDCEAEPLPDEPLTLRFIVRDGREARVMKLPMRYVSGGLETREANFTDARFFSVDELSSLRLSPDLEELLPAVRRLLERHR